MPHYLISYDNRPPRNYNQLYRLMAQWRAVQLADSVWLANLAGPTSAVRDCITAKLQSDDLVAVIELKAGSDWATMNCPSGALLWLSNNITPAMRKAA